MTQDALLNGWYIGLAISGVVVVVAAALLITVLLVARSIERGARIALEQVRQIRENTEVIWQLQDTNAVASDLLAGAQSILGHAGQIASALAGAEQRERRA